MDPTVPAAATSGSRRLAWRVWKQLIAAFAATSGGRGGGGGGGEERGEEEVSDGDAVDDGRRGVTRERPRGGRHHARARKHGSIEARAAEAGREARVGERDGDAENRGHDHEARERAERER